MASRYPPPGQSGRGDARLGPAPGSLLGNGEHQLAYCTSAFDADPTANKDEALSAAALCSNGFHRCKGALDGGSTNVEQCDEVGDGVVAGAVHATQLGLLLGRQFRCVP